MWAVGWLFAIAIHILFKVFNTFLFCNGSYAVMFTFKTLTFEIDTLEPNFIGNYIGKTYDSLVYDGDTLRIICYSLPLNGTPSMKLNVRLQGIDTPELHRGTQEERNAGKYARDTLCSLVTDKYLYVKIVDNDKYATRYIGIVYVLNDATLDSVDTLNDVTLNSVTLNGMSVNDTLIALKCAVPYNGDKKQTFEYNVANGFIVLPVNKN
jgi:endonuclease YncB( thermonuclease family)